MLRWARCIWPESRTFCQQDDQKSNSGKKTNETRHWKTVPPAFIKSISSIQPNNRGNICIMCREKITVCCTFLVFFLVSVSLSCSYAGQRIPAARRVYYSSYSLVICRAHSCNSPFCLRALSHPGRVTKRMRRSHTRFDIKRVSKVTFSLDDSRSNNTHKKRNNNVYS